MLPRICLCNKNFSPVCKLYSGTVSLSGLLNFWFPCQWKLKPSNSSLQFHILCAVLCLVVHLCPTLCDPMDCSQPGSSVYGDSPGKNTEMGCHALLQGIFPTRGWNPGILSDSLRPHEMVGWHHQLNGHEFEQTLGASEGQGDLMHCSS